MPRLRTTFDRCSADPRRSCPPTYVESARFVAFSRMSYVGRPASKKGEPARTLANENTNRRLKEICAVSGRERLRQTSLIVNDSAQQQPDQLRADRDTTPTATDRVRWRSSFRTISPTGATGELALHELTKLSTNGMGWAATNSATCKARQSFLLPCRTWKSNVPPQI